MALRRFGFIVKGAGYEPATHTVTLASPQITTVMVGVSAPEQALPVARAMVADGVQLLACASWASRSCNSRPPL